MALRLTGRTKTIVVSGEFNLDAAPNGAIPEFLNFDGLLAAGRGSRSFITFSFGAISFSASSGQADNAHPKGNGFIFASALGDLSLDEITGGVAGEGTFSGSFEVEELIGPPNVTFQYVATGEIQHFPTFEQIYHRPRKGGVATITVNSAAGTITSTGTIPTNNVLLAQGSYQAQMQVLVGGIGWDGGIGTLVHSWIKARIGEVPLQIDGTAHPESGTFVYQAPRGAYGFDTPVPLVHCDLTGGIDVLMVGTAGDPAFLVLSGAYLNMEPPTQYQVHGFFKTLTGAYKPATQVKFEAHNSGGLLCPGVSSTQAPADGTEIGLNFQQENWEAGRAFLNTGLNGGFSGLKVGGVVDKPGVFLRIDATSLRAAGELDADSAILLRYPQFDAIRMRQQPSVVVDDYTPNPTKFYTNAELSPPDGVACEGSANDGTTVFRYNGGLFAQKLAAFRCEGYRYMRFWIKPSEGDNQTISVTFGEPPVLGFPDFRRYHSFKLGNAGVYSAATIDLCGPTRPSSLWSLQDSRYPILDGILDVPAQSDPAWGLIASDRVTIHWPQETRYLVAPYELYRSTRPRVTFLNEDFGPKYVNSNLDSRFLTRCMVADTDGRRSLELPGRMIGGNFHRYLLAELKTLVADRPGWEIEVLPDNVSKWNYSDLASNLGGGGWIYDGTEAHSWAHKEIGNEGTAWEIIPSQTLINGIIGIFDGGDLFQDRTSQGPFKVAFIKVLRGGFEGLIQNIDGTPRAGEEILFNDDETNEFFGAGFADSIGRYATDAPFAKTDVVIRATVLPNSQIGPKTTKVGIAPRQLRRLCFRLDSLPAGSVALAIGYGAYWLATSTNGIEVQRALQYDLDLEETFSVDPATDCGLPAFSYGEDSKVLILTYRRGDGSTASPFAFYRKGSSDDGETWFGYPDDESTWMENVTQYREVFSMRSHEQIGFGRGLDGFLKGAAYDDAGVKLESWTPKGLEDVVLDDISFDSLYIPESGAIDLAMIVAGATRRFRSSDDGRSFVELV